MTFVEFLEFLCRVAYVAEFKVVTDEEAFHRDEKTKDSKQNSDNWLFTGENNLPIDDYVENLKMLMSHVIQLGAVNIAALISSNYLESKEMSPFQAATVISSPMGKRKKKNKRESLWDLGKI
jgi:hypothetical protein